MCMVVVVGLVIWVSVVMIRAGLRRLADYNDRKEQEWLRGEISAHRAFSNRGYTHTEETKKDRRSEDEAQFKLEQAKADIEYERERLRILYAQLDNEVVLQGYALAGSKEYEKHQRRAATLNSQIHASETRLRKAEYQKRKAMTA